MTNEAMNVFDMSDIGAQVGAPCEEKMFGPHKRIEVQWTPEYELKAMDVLKGMEANGKPFRMVGHPGKGLLTLMGKELRENGLFAYIPQLDVETPIIAFKKGSDDDGISHFEVETKGDDVIILFTMDEVSPVGMHNVIAPDIDVSGKNVIIRSVNHPILPGTCLGLTYADTCKSLWFARTMDDDTCTCAISNTDEFSFGMSRKF